MTSRRVFIQTCASIFPMGLVAAAAQGAAAAPRVALYTRVYDERFAPSVAFGRAARRQGHRTSAIRGDVTGLWYDDLYHRWRGGPAAIAGLTTASSFFCLKMLGQDAGLRVTLHEMAPAGPDHPELVGWLMTPAGPTGA